MYESDDKLVSHPPHYQSKSGLEVIDVIEAFTEGLEGIEATDTGNIIKYACRWKQKNGVQDLKKIMWYCQHLIDILEQKAVEKELSKYTIKCIDCVYYEPYEVDGTEGKCRRVNGLVCYDDCCSFGGPKEKTFEEKNKKAWEFDYNNCENCIYDPVCSDNDEPCRSCIEKADEDLPAPYFSASVTAKNCDNCRFYGRHVTPCGTCTVAHMPDFEPSEWKPIIPWEAN